MVKVFIDNITLIGSSHISSESIDEISDFFNTYNPDIIAVELDLPRFQALTSNEKRNLSFKDIRYIGLTGYIFALIGQYVQKKLGSIVDISPGSDMLSAIDLAKKHQKMLVLIDRNIQITLKHLSNQFTWKERFRLFYDLISSPFRRSIEGINIKDIDLRKMPSQKFIEIALHIIEKRYPSIYKAIIHERNITMAKNLYNIQHNYPNKKIMAVVGAGHLPGMKKIMERDFNHV